MMVGHALLAFALAVLAARRLGWPAERALSLGAVAGAFAAVPDADMAYALVGVAQAGVGGVWHVTEAFWGSSTLVHRAVTHSLVVGAVAAVAFALTTREGVRRLAGGALLAGLVWMTLAESGVLGAAVMAVFALAGVGVAALAAARTDLGPRALFAAAALGLLSHPFGDLFTGEPPQFLYPFDAVLVAERVALAPDPTLNLLAVFALELAVVWLAAAVYLRATGERFAAHVDSRATLGAAYAIAAFVLPAPTLDVSYHFVFSVLAVGIVGVAPRLHPRRVLGRADLGPTDRRDALTWTLTGTAAVTLAVLAYAAAYLAA